MQCNRKCTVITTSSHPISKKELLHTRFEFISLQSLSSPSPRAQGTIFLHMQVYCFLQRGRRNGQRDPIRATGFRRNGFLFHIPGADMPSLTLQISLPVLRNTANIHELPTSRSSCTRTDGNVKLSATSSCKFGQKLSHRVMPKVLVLKVQGRHVM